MTALLFIFCGLCAAYPLALAGDAIARRHVAADTWSFR